MSPLLYPLSYGPHVELSSLSRKVVPRSTGTIMTMRRRRITMERIVLRMVRRMSDAMVTLGTRECQKRLDVIVAIVQRMQGA